MDLYIGEQEAVCRGHGAKIVRQRDTFPGSHSQSPVTPGGTTIADLASRLVAALASLRPQACFYLSREDFSSFPLALSALSGIACKQS
jgi:hypothetical protein